MKRTRWFPVSAKPKRIGWYDYKYSASISGVVFRFWWNGRGWRDANGSNVMSWAKARWRGLTEKSYENQ